MEGLPKRSYYLVKPYKALLGSVAVAVAVAFAVADTFRIETLQFWHEASRRQFSTVHRKTLAMTVVDPSPALRLVQQWLIDHDFGYESFEAWQDRFVESNLRRGLAGYCWEWQFLKAVFEGAFGD